ncbi:MAG: toxin HigB-2 [Gemmatimonadetes bacterium]|nr:toxin HigB-2 [Gemmatimonadota bacterium]
MSRTPLLHFIQTESFVDSASDVPITDAEVQHLEEILLADPTAGDVIPGSGGLRKVRLPVKGKGSRGGARVIYYYVVQNLTVYLLFAYSKSASDDLSSAGKKYLRTLAAQIDAEGGA